MGVLTASCVTLLVTMVLREAQPAQLTSQQRSSIDSLVEALRTCRRIPGLSLAVVNKHDVLYSRGYGMADRQTGTPVTPDTLFPIGSTSKAFTTTLLADALANSKYNWNTPVKDILGDAFQLYTPELTKQVSLADLVAHRTGLSDVFLLFMVGYASGTTRSDVMKMMQYVKPTHPLRTSIMYNNHLYGVAGLVTEAITGNDSTWEQLVQEKLYNPIGMSSSGFIGKTSFDNVASSYTVFDGQLIEVAKDLTTMVVPMGPAGGLLSTANDMARWIQFHLNAGKVGKQQIVNKVALEETYSSYMHFTESWHKRDLTRPTFPVEDMLLAYGLGWIYSVYRGYRKITHSGGITTYKSQVWMFPDKGVGVYVGASGPDTEEVSQALISIAQFMSDLTLGEKPWLNSTTACSFPLPWKNNTSPNQSSEQASKQSDPLSETPQTYAGNYKHPAFGTIIIGSSRDSATLTLEMGRFLRANLLYNAETKRFRLSMMQDSKWFWSKTKMEIWFDSYKKPSILYVPLVSKKDPTAFIAESSSMPYTFLPATQGPCTSHAFSIQYWPKHDSFLTWVLLELSSLFTFTTICYVV